MTQDEQKRAVAHAARDYVAAHLPAGSILGVGTGSTANFFIDAIAAAPALRERMQGAVASSLATQKRLESHGIAVLDLNEVQERGLTMPIYVDGADEIDHGLAMIKGGGGALTREKIVAAVAGSFICVCDATKRVERMGRFPLPVEVIPMARAQVAAALATLGGTPRQREGFVTDNGNLILDVHGLSIADPAALEAEINQITGVVSNGLFARRGADVLLLAGANGVQHFTRPAVVHNTRATIEQFWAACTARQWAAFAQTLHPEVRYDVPQTREHAKGREAFVEVFRTWPGEWTLQLESLIADQSQAVTRIRFVLGDDVMTGITCFEFEDGLIRRITDYWPAAYDPPPRASTHLQRD